LQNVVPDNILKIGQMTQVELYTTRATRSLSIPENALYEDDAQQIVFVHAEGESFEKRAVETGSRYKGWISIQSGLKAGERVVTQGGYLVKLASTSKEIGHGHAH
ncbi:MAG: efflux RND transporter periplasmic adaptor subunit, partial [Planctomycetes bacterium]|nr:efflux RND transporter periplasmic adaptor subunit [Planctomycetota bacterium]